MTPGGATPTLRIGLLGLYLLAVTPTVLQAGAVEKLDNISAAVRNFMESKLKDGYAESTVEVGPLDSRLRLAACGAPLETFFPAGSRILGNTAVGVRCRGPHPWLLYIPVSTRIYQEVLVAARPLSRGARIAPADIKLEVRDLARMTIGYLSDPQQAVGKVLKRPLALGGAVSPKMLEAPRLVHRGERITIVARTAGMEVRMAGKALMDGGAGDRVRVRNLATKRIIEGTVTANGAVRVRM